LFTGFQPDGHDIDACHSVQQPGSGYLTVTISRLILILIASVVLAAGLSACGGSGGDESDKAKASLDGAGSSLVDPMVQAWKPELRDRSGIDLSYNPIGSGGGIQAISTRTVDFGASDAPLTPDQADACKGCVLVPWALSATSVSYNLPEAEDDLKLTGPVIADIFLGKITNWSDPKITQLNPGKQLPSQAISPIYRSDGSGDTYAFTSYLTAVSPEWKDRVGSGTSVNFPAGTGSKGNSGVAGTLTRTKGALGYISVAYAVQNKLDVASIQNAAGEFVPPDLEGIAAAAEAMGGPKPDNSIPIVDPPASAKRAYPISTFTYAIVPKDSAKATELKELLEYAVGPGQEFAERFVFAKLPEQVVALAKETIASIGR
jgi:phosphate transport system substrate-binding protein